MKLEAVADPSAAGDSGVPHAAELLAFADATVKGTDDEISEARENLANAVSAEALVDSAAIIANFEKMNRIADATGIELDAPVRTFSSGFREELGINKYAAADLTKPTGMFSRVIAKVLFPLAVLKYTKSGSKN